MKFGIGRAASVAVFAFLSCPVARSDNDGQRDHSRSILGQLPTTSQRIVSTVPANGDVNPYGVAFVPEDFREGGPLRPGDILVSNFNNNQNQQGTGTTIVRITPGGQFAVFFQTRPAARQARWSGPGRRCFGTKVANLTESAVLDGPWDLTLIDGGSHAQIFVSNVLSGTVTRLDVSISGDQFHMDSKTQIGSGYTHGFDPNALVIGPTGLAYDRERNVLYVASTGDNVIFAIADLRSTSHDAGQGWPWLRMAI